MPSTSSNRRPQRGVSRLAALSLWALGLLCLFVAPPPAAAQTADPGLAGREVYVGVHLLDIAEVDLRAGAVEASFLLWVRWAGDAAAEPPIEIVNADLNLFREVARESVAGWNSVRWEVQGEIRNRFLVAEFPFDRYPIEFRLRLDRAEGRLISDLAASSAERSFSAAGWLYEPYFEARRSAMTLASDFGSVEREGVTRQFDEVSFLLTMERPRLAIALRYLPLLIVTAVAAVALWAPPERLEVASGMIVTALLASIAFYFAEASGLPNVPYLTRAHTVFLGSYLLIVTALAIAFLTFFMRRWRWLSAITGHVASIALLAALAYGSWWFLRPIDVAIAAPDQRARIDRPATAEPEARVAMPALRDSLRFAVYGSILARGAASHDPEGRRIPHLLEELPATTNDRVRYLRDGGMRVIWRLKPNLRWGDGERITARDMMLDIRRRHGDRVRLTLLDDRTLEAVYTGRDRAFLEPGWILPHRLFEPIFASEGWGGVISRLRTAPPPLDGPYIVKRFDAGEEVLLERNPFFAGRRPIFDRVRLIDTGSTDAYLGAVRSGALHVGYENSETTAARFEGDAGLVLERFPRPTFYRLDIDLTAAGLSDPRVRRALAMAINRAALNRSGAPPAGYRAPGDPDYNPDLTPLAYDPAAARAILAEAGYPDGFPLKFYVLADRLDSAERLLIEAVERDLAAAGVEVERVVYASTRELPSPNGGALFRLSTASEARVGFLWDLSYRTPPEERVARMRALYGDEAAELWRTAEQSPYAPRRAAASQRLQAIFERLQPTILLSAEDRRTVRSARLIGWDPGAVSAEAPFWNIEDWRLAEPDPDAAAPPPAE